MFGVVGGYGFPVSGDGEVNFEDTMAKLVIEKKGFAGISIGVAQNAAESMSDIGVIFGPTIIEAVGWLGARDIVYNRDVLGRILIMRKEDESGSNTGNGEDSQKNNNDNISDAFLSLRSHELIITCG